MRTAENILAVILVLAVRRVFRTVFIRFLQLTGGVHNESNSRVVVQLRSANTGNLYARFEAPAAV
jgi:hypothetical protein